MSFQLGEYFDKQGQLFVVDLYRPDTLYPIKGYLKADPDIQEEWTKEGQAYPGDDSIEDLVLPEEEKVKVALTQEDIPQGAAIRHKDWPADTWELISGLSVAYVRINNLNVFFSDFENEEWEIRPLGGEWQPFYKLV